MNELYECGPLSGSLKLGPNQMPTRGEPLARIPRAHKLLRCGGPQRKSRAEKMNCFAEISNRRSVALPWLGRAFDENPILVCLFRSVARDESLMIERIV